MLEFIVIVCAVAALWPQSWWLCAILAFTGLTIGPRMAMCFDCCCGAGDYVENPFRATQAVVVALLSYAAARWHRVKPTPLPALRRLAMYAAVISILCTVGSMDGEMYDALDFARVALAASFVLLACLVLEVRFHVPPLPTATARAAAPPPDRTAS